MQLGDDMPNFPLSRNLGTVIYFVGLMPVSVHRPQAFTVEDWDMEADTDEGEDWDEDNDSDEDGTTDSYELYTAGRKSALWWARLKMDQGWFRLDHDPVQYFDAAGQADSSQAVLIELKMDKRPLVARVVPGQGVWAIGMWRRRRGAFLLRRRLPDSIWGRLPEELFEHVVRSL